ncbi:sensor histidine kinase [Streptococcus macacae]|uniref:histidine kinase n=1 Tax=Streptococcus macacae NCTC 11558 TaxID=764298 RepID=G5JVE9_9STRE|nr:HAMP domain-containing sensor histidine kinase [Streptococcus macacae]EHJ51629.1 ATPase/histidine kinase/DNA gyrase B/HSP90 domain protein [Streptococcus macacae NCTC 11558]SUN78545.1 histidine kinase [Streptococcus macacae NCTC 11558]
MDSVKFFTKLLTKYVLLIFALIIGFVFVYGLIFLTYLSHYGNENPELLYTKIAQSSQQNNFLFDKSSRKEMNKQKTWAMVLNQDGNIVQSYHLPKQLKRHYTNTDLVKFSRWYLEDYPVFSYVRGQQILVLGYPKKPKKHSLAKFNLYANTQFIRNCLILVPVFLGIILLLIFILLSRSKLRIKKEMKPIVAAVASLSQGQNVALNEKGNLSEIKAALNETSHILEESYLMKEQWIRGVSHDLRNPLMLISGYTSQLEQQYGRGKKIEQIENQIQNMQEMISNLNLSYLLDNQKHHSDFSNLDLVVVLRTVIADILNNYDTITLHFDLPAEAVLIKGDAILLERAFRNLLLNSIMHSSSNQIDLTYQLVENKVLIIIADQGDITAEKITELNQKSTNYETHGMGTVITKQIIKLHQGETIFSDNHPGLKVTIALPLIEEQIIIKMNRYKVSEKSRRVL